MASSLYAGPRYRRVVFAIALSVGTIVFHAILCTLLSYSILDLISPHPRINAGWNQKSTNNTNQTDPNFNSTMLRNNTIPTNTAALNTTIFNNTVPSAPAIRLNSTQVPIMMQPPTLTNDSSLVDVDEGS